MIMHFEAGPKRCIKRCRPHRPRNYENIKIKTEASGRKNTPPGLSLIVQMERGKQDLRRVYFCPTALDHVQEILSFWKVITGLCCLFCLCLYYFLLSSVPRLVIFCLCTYIYYIIYIYIFLPLFTTKSDMIFCRILKKVRGRRKLTFQTTAFRKVIRAKILF